MRHLKEWWDLIILYFMRIFLVLLISLKSLFTLQRMSHQNGIVATGKIRIVDNLTIPANDFFTPGREFDCRLRHATIRFLDDAILGPRSASLKFADSDDHSPLDILMNTGTATPFYSMLTFWQFMKTSIAGGREKSAQYLQDNPHCYVNFRRALRRDPKTFAQLYYYTQTIFEFQALDEQKRYIRFRLIPNNNCPETGIPDPKDLETVWFQEAKPNEIRSRNYLKDEYCERVKAGKVIYHLQAQIHEASVINNHIVLNSVYEWSEESHPWKDIATVSVDGLLEHDDRSNPPDYSVHRGDHVLFSLANRPSCIKLLKAKSIRDPASLDYLRLAGVWARRVRLFAIKIFGPAKKINDKRKLFDRDDELQNTLRSDDIYCIAILPQQLIPERQHGRNQRLEIARATYQFWGGDLSPPYVKNFPDVESFTFAHTLWIELNYGISIINIAIANLINKLDPALSMAYYDNLYPILPKPSVSVRYKSDEEFGRQRLNGINPFVIKKYKNLSDPNFPITDDIISGLLDQNMTLADALEEHRLYVVSYPNLEGLPTKPGYYVTAPICLLYINNEKKLMPIAIQLGQTPEAGPIFTPKDDYWLWRMVKAFVQSADAQYQESVSHLLRTHLVMETIAVATHRQLAAGHPVNELLIPHLHSTLAINNSARRTMLAENGAVDHSFSIGVKGVLELIEKEWNDPDWSFTQYHLERDLHSRGVDNDEELPGYYFRDDARQILSIIREFVQNVINYFYQKEDDVLSDFELQAWCKELADIDKGNLRGFPEQLHSIDQLEELLTTIIFTASACHSATNNGQYDMYGYIPNAPGNIISPPPKNKEPWTEKMFVEALPKGQDAAYQIIMSRLLSLPTESPLGIYSPDFFAGHLPIVSYVMKFNEQLHKMSLVIRARNKMLPVPYTYLDPSKIYPSIEI